MADQRNWIKVWNSAATDPALSIMPNEQFGQWVKFGIYLAQHGTHGRVVIQEPPKGVTHPLQNMLQVVSWNDVKLLLENFPNCDVTTRYTKPVTLEVTWRNWRRYQEETSWERMRRYRARRVTPNVTPRGDGTGRAVEVSSSKKTSTPKTPKPPPAADDFDGFWSLYPRHVAKHASQKAWRAALKHTAAAVIIAGLQLHLPYLRSCQPTMIPHASSWLNGKRWLDDVMLANSDNGSAPSDDDALTETFLCSRCNAMHELTDGKRKCTGVDWLTGKKSLLSKNDVLDALP